jgi:hypothetical protein
MKKSERDRKRGRECACEDRQGIKRKKGKKVCVVT